MMWEIISKTITVGTAFGGIVAFALGYNEIMVFLLLLAIFYRLGDLGTFGDR